MPKAQWLLDDGGYDADGFKEALQAKDIQPCSQVGSHATSRSDRTNGAIGDVVASMFGRLNDWHRVASRCDCCPTGFVSVSPSLPASFSGSDQ
jgi:hypothetical protein